ncbi:hypothetical protein TRFO_13863 [Tritrichomonas foetus]|uniref:SEC7 domain-containing protein n=1 Tax=Tritrichomonas foetus TaxID=1144522 RepID=A0A1J4L1D8_9EUKA|nr:hypothetical protein TRFO_13863 [Tritrichomonas foetus]|eukprot:OHT15701.1 hypothetical protein TRFO_13863 [Tritrichomonas foetus]
MKQEQALLISDECDRLLAELRSISQNVLFLEIQDELVSIKKHIFTDTVEISQILIPFERIITHEQATDVITALALASINTFISFSLIESEEDVATICCTLGRCQFQSTSEYDCMCVSYKILMCMISLCRTDFLKSKSLSFMFDYILTEIQNNEKNPSPLLIDALSAISAYIFRYNINENFLQEKVISNLYFLCCTNDGNQPNSYFRQCGLSGFLSISRVNVTESLMAATCSLLSKFLQTIDTRDNFVLVLRLFTHVFISHYLEFYFPFSKCFMNLLNFAENITTTNQYRHIVYEILSDFISQSDFLVNLFINMNDKKFIQNIFDKLVSSIFSFPENSSALSKLLSPIVKSKYYIDALNDNIDRVKDEEEKYEMLSEFSKKFNLNPFSFIDKELTPKTLAKYLFEAPSLSRKQIGEFFGKNKKFCMDTLQEYLLLLDFSSIDFDSSIRLFLSGFQIAGEGQIIDRIFEYFSQRFYQCGSDRIHFKSPESVHILAYGWLMMHTSFHNNNVTSKPKIDEFKQMMAKQNNGEDFAEDFLLSIFNSVKNARVPFEDSEQEGSAAHWRLQMCRQRILNLNLVQLINDKELNLNEQKKDENEISEHVKNEHENNLKPIAEIEKLMFNKIWETNKKSIIDACSLNYLLFDSICSVASKFNLNDIVDNFINKFSQSAIDELLQSRETISLSFLGTIITKYGSSVRTGGWKSFIKLLTTLLELDLLNDEILTFQNIAEDLKPIILCHKLVSSRRHHRNSVFSLFLSRRSSSEEFQRVSSKSSLKDIVTKSEIEKVVSFSSTTFSDESLNCIIEAIELVCQEIELGAETDQMRIAFCVIFAEKIFSENKTRISHKINHLSDFLVRTLKLKNGTFLPVITLNEAFVTLLNLWEYKENRENILDLLDKVSQVQEISKQGDLIEKGLSIFFDKHFDSFIEMNKLSGVLNLLQIGLVNHSEKSFKLFDRFKSINSGSFDEVRFPLIQVNAALCLIDQTKSRNFSDMKDILLVKQTTAKQWELIFNNVLFPLTTKRTKYDDLLGLILDTFEFCIEEIKNLSLFEPMWFRILSLVLEYCKRCDSSIKTTIEGKLSSCIMEMKNQEIFNSSSPKLWNLTKLNVEAIFPSIV